MRESTRSDVVLKVLIPLGTKFLLSEDFYLESVFGHKWLRKVPTKCPEKGQIWVQKRVQKGPK